MKIFISLSTSASAIRKALESAIGKKFDDATSSTKAGFTSLLQRVFTKTPKESRDMVVRVGEALGSSVKAMQGRTKGETVFKLGDTIVSCKVATGKFPSVLVQYITPIDN